MQQALEAQSAVDHEARCFERRIVGVGKAQMQLAFIVRRGFGNAGAIALVEIDARPTPRELHRHASALKPRAEDSDTLVWRHCHEGALQAARERPSWR